MAHNSSENLIQSDSSTSTDELNNGSHSRSGKVSKKMFHKKKTAFVGGANSVTSSSVTSSPQQHPIIVVGTADVHRPLSPPKPLPRKQLSRDSVATNRKHFAKVDDIVEMSVSGDSESNNSEKGKTAVAKREEIELLELRSPSGSSGAHSDKAEESKMFFARSRKNTIVTNIDEISTKSSGPSSRSESKSRNETKPLAKPRQHIPPQYEIVHEKSSAKQIETPEHVSRSELSQSNSIDSDSETFTESEISKRGKCTNEKVGLETDPGTTGKVDEIERLVGIYIHSSSELKFDYNVHKPMVRCSVIDTTTGQLLRNGKAAGKKQSQGPDEKDSIQAAMTKGCRFTSSSIFQCQWEQLLIINESITQLMRDSVIIFFEILDTPSSESDLFFSKVSREKSDWHYVCWGFLRPGDGIKSSNVDRRSCLQLNRYQRRNLLRKCSLNVYDQFRFNRIRYPATLTVTVKGIIPSESRLDFPKEASNQPNTEFRNIKSEVQKLNDTENAGMATATNFLRRLPGQICKYPTTVHKTHLQPSSKGCLASKFSPMGQYLAYSFCSDYNIQIATAPDLKLLNTLRGHTNFVYDLDWLVDKRKNSFPLHLVSASSDRTAVVWTIEKDRISLTILPHPSFLYTAKFLVNLSTDGCCLFAVTGGRDCTIRVWKIGPDHNIDLLQESNDHENYITSIVCPTTVNSFYSSDWNGFIFEWSYQTISSNFQVTRKFPRLSEGISSLQLHPKNEHRLYAQLKTHQIVCFDATTEIVLNSLGATDDDRRINNKFTISPCGSTIYTILGDTNCMYNILTGSLQSSLNVPHVRNQRGSYISHLDYHPKLFLLCAALYGPNGGIVLLTHKTDGSSSDGAVETPQVRQDSFDDRWMLLKQNVHPKSSEMLGNIIRRIDDILHQPQANRNETDDLKNENIANWNHRTHDSDPNVADDGAVGYVEVEAGSLTVVSGENESDSGSGGTFTVRSRSIAEVSNRTFELNKNADGSNGLERVNDGTYSIKAGASDSEDTTISESM